MSRFFKALSKRGRTICLGVLIALLSPASAHSTVSSDTAEPGAAGPEKQSIVAIIPYDAPPTYFLDPATGQASGFVVDVFNRIAEKAGLKVRYIFGHEWAGIIDKIQSGEADAIPGIGIGEQRKNILAYTEPLDAFPISFFMRSQSGSQDIQQKGITVGALGGSLAYDYLKKRGIKAVPYDGFKSGLFDLLAGHIDAFFCPQPTLLALAREAGMEDRIRIVQGPAVEVRRAIAVSVKNRQLLDRLNRAVQSFVHSPEYQKIYLRWYGSPKPFWTRKRIVLAMSVCSVFAVGLMAAWRYSSVTKLNRLLLRKIDELDRTEKNRVRLEAAIAAAADAVVLTDAKGYIRYVNPAFERMSGFSQHEAVGGTLHILDSGRHDEAFFRNIREALKREGVWTGRMINRKKDGTLYEEESTFSVVREEDGSIISHVAIKRDVTDRTRLEAMAAAVEAMNNIGYIFSGVRHEIGNPINSLKLLMSLARKKLQDRDAGSVEDYIDRSVAEIAKVEELLRNLRSFNMYEHLELQTVPAEEFIEKVLVLVREDCGRKGIELSVSAEQAVGTLYCDPRALQQVLINILANASDAVQEQQGARIAVAVARADGRARITITDNGAGMNREQQKNLFKPFHTTKAHGTGLGLVIAKKMVTGMLGTIEVTSGEHAGTSVAILLQREAPAAARERPADQAFPRLM